MALNINVFKNILLMPFVIVLAIISLPLIFIFNLVDLPFAKKRINRLSDALKNDWLPRKKYIYIGLSSGFALSDFVKDKVIRKYGDHIIWDEWDAKQNEWTGSEPDYSQRVTTLWQDIGGDFDGDPMIIIATYSLDDFTISNKNNFHQFWLHNDNSVVYNGKKLNTEAAQKKIEAIVEKSLNSWR